jgi:UDP-N-acetylglucosamine 2-epimerase (hydrolysing)
LTKKKKIVFLTGTRADFGKLNPLMQMIEKSNDFECYVFITGMHTLSKYGSTFQEVEKHGYENIFVFMNQTNTTDQDIILANTIIGFSNFVKEISPDMIVIHGDRIESLAGAIIGAINNILVSHIEGGEISGTIDELIRHATTKMSHLHFVANENARRRLIQMGESEERISVIGSPDIDVMKSNELPSIEEVKEYYEIQFKNYAILIFHPVTTELNSLKEQIKNVVSAAIESKENFVVIYPNNDTGTNIILDEYKRISENKNFRVFPSLRFKYFLTLLKNSNCIIGNSSAGIREAEVYGIHTINIGTRQKNRSENKQIINIEPVKKVILESILEIKDKELIPISNFSKNFDSAKKFYELLCDENIWKVSYQKQFIDFSHKKIN